MKLQKKPSGVLLVDHRLSNHLSVGIEIREPVGVSRFLTITLPDMGIYRVITIGGYSAKRIDENKHIVKYVGNITFKPQFIETIFRALREEE